MFRIGECRYGISKKERERNSPCLGVERLSEVRHIHNRYGHRTVGVLLSWILLICD